jgi:ABC-2 type transport system ATP-binding protein
MEKTSSSGHTAIQIDGLTKKFGDYRAVSDLSLDVNSGEIFGFLGLNGAGKSTTIKMMLSLLKPAYSGTFGQRFRKHPDTKPEVSGHFAG